MRTTAQNICNAIAMSVSVPDMLPPQIRNGVDCIEANGSRSSTRRALSGRKGRGMTAPEQNSATIATIIRVPETSSVKNAEI